MDLLGDFGDVAKGCRIDLAKGGAWTKAAGWDFLEKLGTPTTSIFWRSTPQGIKAQTPGSFGLQGRIFYDFSSGCTTFNSE